MLMATCMTRVNAIGNQEPIAECNSNISHEAILFRSGDNLIIFWNKYNLDQCKQKHLGTSTRAYHNLCKYFSGMFYEMKDHSI